MSDVDDADGHDGEDEGAHRLGAAEGVRSWVKQYRSREVAEDELHRHRLHLCCTTGGNGGGGPCGGALIVVTQLDAVRCVTPCCRRLGRGCLLLRLHLRDLVVCENVACRQRPHV